MFDSVLMQVAASVTDATIISSVAIIVGVLALIVSSVAYIKAKSQDPRIQYAADTAVYVGRLSTLTARKAAENQENIRDLIKYIDLALEPKDIEKAKAMRNDLIEKLDKQIEVTNAQYNRLIPFIPGEANVDTDPTLPREEDLESDTKNQLLDSQNPMQEPAPR